MLLSGFITKPVAVVAEYTLSVSAVTVILLEICC